ncbi:MAG: BON domain-containing protein [Planctomycetaceae bacterium]
MPRYSRILPDSSPTLANAAQRHLQRKGRAAFSGVECSADDEGAVILRGRVPSFYLKQLAQEVVRQTDGVSCIVNELEVDYGAGRSPHHGERLTMSYSDASARESLGDGLMT